MLQIACGSSLMQSMIVVPTLQEALTDTPGLPLTYCCCSTVEFSEGIKQNKIAAVLLSIFLSSFPYIIQQA